MDERVTQIRRNLKEMRSLGMDTARLADEIHSSETHRRLMFCVTAIDDAADSNNQVDTHLHLIDVAYDEDVARGARNERHLRVLDTESEREEARKVGRETP